jgi:hypothetical protein
MVPQLSGINVLVFELRNQASGQLTMPRETVVEDFNSLLSVVRQGSPVFQPVIEAHLYGASGSG